MYQGSQKKVENEAILKAFKGFFGLCNNVNIVLLSEDHKDDPYIFQKFSLNVANHPSMNSCAYMNALQLQTVCKKIGDTMKESLLLRCKNYPVKETLAKNLSHNIIFDQCYRYKEQVGLIGDTETFCSLLERMSKVDYRDGQYHYNCGHLNGSNFMSVDKEEDLYLIKGNPTFYLKCKIKRRNKNTEYLPYNEILFGFYLETSNVEVYKV